MKLSVFFLSAIATLLFSTQSFAQKSRIEVKDLPRKGQALLKEHFKGQSIEYIVVDNDTFNVDYTIKLATGIEVELDKNGEWTELESIVNLIPWSLIPKPISTYISKNYPNTTIAKIEKDRKGYEVELSNGMELKFNSRGKFKGMDR